MLALNDQLLSHLFTDVDIHGHEEEDDSINACEPSSHGSTSTSTSAHPGKGPHHHETNKSKSPLVHLLHGALAFTFLAGIIAGYHCIVNNGISNGNDSDGNDNDHDHGAMNMILGLKHFPFEILHAAETETATLHGYHSYFQFHHQDPSAQQQQQQDMTESSPMDRFPFTVAALGVISCIFLYDTVRHYWNRRNLYKYK